MQDLQQLFRDWILANAGFQRRMATATNRVQLAAAMAEGHVFTTLWVSKLFHIMQTTGVNMTNQITNYYRVELPQNNEFLEFYGDLDPTNLSYEAATMAMKDLGRHKQRLAKYGLNDPLYKLAVSVLENLSMRRWVTCVSSTSEPKPWI